MAEKLGLRWHAQDASDLFGSDGQIISSEEREERRRRAGLCRKCGVVRTHEPPKKLLGHFTPKPITNADVYKGHHIDCWGGLCGVKEELCEAVTEEDREHDRRRSARLVLMQTHERHLNCNGGLCAIKALLREQAADDEDHDKYNNQRLKDLPQKSEATAAAETPGAKDPSGGEAPRLTGHVQVGHDQRINDLLRKRASKAAEASGAKKYHPDGEELQLSSHSKVVWPESLSTLGASSLSIDSVEDRSPPAAARDGPSVTTTSTVMPDGSVMIETITKTVNDDGSVAEEVKTWSLPPGQGALLGRVSPSPRNEPEDVADHEAGIGSDKKGKGEGHDVAGSGVTSSGRSQSHSSGGSIKLGSRGCISLTDVLPSELPHQSIYGQQGVAASTQQECNEAASTSEEPELSAPPLSQQEVPPSYFRHESWSTKCGSDSGGGTGDSGIEGINVGHGGAHDAGHISDNTSTVGVRDELGSEAEETRDDYPPKSHFYLILDSIAESDPALTDVVLTDCNFCPTEAKKLAEALQGNTSVIGLHLSWNEVGTEGAAALAEMLFQNSTLSCLTLAQNNVGTEGAKSLAKALCQNSSLKKLILRSNGVGDEGARAFIEAMRENNSLSCLDLIGNGISKDLMKEIAMLVEINNEAASQEEARRCKVANCGKPPPSSVPVDTLPDQPQDQSAARLPARQLEKQVGWRKTEEEGEVPRGKETTSEEPKTEFDQHFNGTSTESLTPTKGDLHHQNIGAAEAKKPSDTRQDNGVTATVDPEGAPRHNIVPPPIKVGAIWQPTQGNEKCPTKAVLPQAAQNGRRIGQIGQESRDRELAEKLWSEDLQTTVGAQSIQPSIAAASDSQPSVPKTDTDADAESANAIGDRTTTDPSNVKKAATPSAPPLPPEQVTSHATSASLALLEGEVSQRHFAEEDDLNYIPIAQPVAPEDEEEVLNLCAAGEVMLDDERPRHTRGSGFAAGTHLTAEELAAVNALTNNIADFERSLESVRELPASLHGASLETKDYFGLFTNAFERTYVAAQAISTGAVEGALSGVGDEMLEAVLNSVGWGADLSNIPFVGCISIFTSMMLYQRQTRQNNLMCVFQDFFRGSSRDQYLLTYRALAEQICLGVDFRERVSDADEGTSKEWKLVRKLICYAKKRLEKAHRMAMRDFKPVEVKAMADLATLTEAVLWLYQEDRGTFNSLKVGSEKDKISFLLEELGVVASSPAVVKVQTSADPSSSAANPTFREEGMSRSVKSSARIRSLEQQLRNQMKIIRRLEDKLKSETDMCGSDVGGGQMQCQVVRSRHARSRGQKPADAVAEQDRIRELGDEMEIVRNQLASITEQMEASTVDHLIASRVLTMKEAFHLIETIVHKASDNVEVTSNGHFRLDGRHHQIGYVPGSRFSSSKPLWKGKTKMKIDQTYDGTKSIMCWFDKNSLRFVYEKHIRAAVKDVFQDDFASVDFNYTDSESLAQTERGRQELLSI